MVRVRTLSLILCGLALTTLAFAKTNKTIVTYPTFAVSGPVADMPVEYSLYHFQMMPEPRQNPNKAQPGPYEDPVVQKEAGRNLDIAVGVNFDGIGSPGYAPSDSNMAIGPNEIVEVVNVDFQVFNKTGGSIAGPTSITNIFASLAGDCSSGTDGDPVVLYDRAADRWLLSMIGSGATTSECVAVSQTNDPTGAYFLYGYSFGANLNDYPKFGTWATASNSAYLTSYDIFIDFESYGGAALCGLDRTKMLAGSASPAQLCQMTTSSEFSYLPSDMDGPTPRLTGRPEFSSTTTTAQTTSCSCVPWRSTSRLGPLLCQRLQRSLSPPSATHATAAAFPSPGPRKSSTRSAISRCTASPCGTSPTTIARS